MKPLYDPQPENIITQKSVYCGQEHLNTFKHIIKYKHIKHIIDF